MPRNITKKCPGCGKLSKIEKWVYKLFRKAFEGSRCGCGHRRSWSSSYSRRARKKLKVRLCECGCGHTGPCVFNEKNQYIERDIKCGTPDCVSVLPIATQRRMKEMLDE